MELKTTDKNFNLEEAAAQFNAACALKAGIGRTSGLGEFWNLELAQKSLLVPIGVVAAERSRRRGEESDLFLSSAEASERDVLSSSMERLKTPSLGERACWGMRPGVGVGVSLELNGKLAKVFDSGAVRGPSS